MFFVFPMIATSEARVFTFDTRTLIMESLNYLWQIMSVVKVVQRIFTSTRTPPVENRSQGLTNSGVLSVQRQPVDHAHRHRHILELTCDFNSSIDFGAPVLSFERVKLGTADWSWRALVWKSKNHDYLDRRQTTPN